MPMSERQRNHALRTCERPLLRKGQNQTISAAATQQILALVL